MYQISYLLNEMIKNPLEILLILFVMTLEVQGLQTPEEHDFCTVRGQSHLRNQPPSYTTDNSFFFFKDIRTSFSFHYIHIFRTKPVKAKPLGQGLERGREILIVN